MTEQQSFGKAQLRGRFSDFGSHGTGRRRYTARGQDGTRVSLQGLPSKTHLARGLACPSC